MGRRLGGEFIRASLSRIYPQGQVPRHEKRQVIAGVAGCADGRHDVFPWQPACSSAFAHRRQAGPRAMCPSALQNLEPCGSLGGVEA